MGEGRDRDGHEQPESEGEQSSVFPTDSGGWSGTTVRGIGQVVRKRESEALSLVHSTHTAKGVKGERKKEKERKK